MLEPQERVSYWTGQRAGRWWPSREGKERRGNKSWASSPGVHMLEQVTKQSSSCLLDDAHLGTLGIKRGETRGEKGMDEGITCILETEGPFF